jgi:hypothetical protein
MVNNKGPTGGVKKRITELNVTSKRVYLGASTVDQEACPTEGKEEEEGLAHRRGANVLFSFVPEQSLADSVHTGRQVGVRSWLETDPSAKGDYQRSQQLCWVRCFRGGK